MGNQVHSIHLPDSFLFLKGALLWTTGGLLCKQSLHWLSGTAYLLVCRKPSARGGGEAKKSATRRKSRKVAQLSWLEEELVAQSYLTLCDPTECRPPSSSVHGILQATKLDWVAFASPGDLPDPGIEPGSPALQTDSLPSEVKKRKSGQNCKVLLG